MAPTIWFEECGSVVGPLDAKNPVVTQSEPYEKEDG